MAGSQVHNLSVISRSITYPLLYCIQFFICTERCEKLISIGLVRIISLVDVVASEYGWSSVKFIEICLRSLNGTEKYHTEDSGRHVGKCRNARGRPAKYVTKYIVLGESEQGL